MPLDLYIARPSLSPKRPFEQTLSIRTKLIGYKLAAVSTHPLRDLQRPAVGLARRSDFFRSVPIVAAAIADVIKGFRSHDMAARTTLFQPLARARRQLV